MKKILSLLLCAALLLGLAACGAKSEATYSAGAVVEEAAPEAPAMMADNAASLKGANSGSTALPEGRKWIITIDMNVETEDLDSLMTDLDQKIKALNGYVEDQNIHNGSSYASRRYRSANLTVRIPDEKVDQFTDEISGLANVVNQNLRREDITLKYVSTSSRVTALETEEARLLELLAKADNMTDLLEILVKEEFDSVTVREMFFCKFFCPHVMNQTQRRDRAGLQAQASFHSLSRSEGKFSLTQHLLKRVNVK